MAVSVVPGSAAMAITTRPSVDVPSANAGATMDFTCTDYYMDCECKITGAPADNPAGWTLGLIQLEWIETNWGFYRGQSNQDGSCLLQRARPPARPAQGCRDTLISGAMFLDNMNGQERMIARAGQAFPLRMTARFYDSPGDSYPLTRLNSKTGKVNYLSEVQLEFHFCTVLSLLSPGLIYHHLKHRLWNVHWQARFHPTNFTNLAAPWTITPVGGMANSANISQAFDGGPTDKRFVYPLTNISAPNCNIVAGNAASAPNARESNVWADFDVRH